jgi:hypothetical protein
MYNILIKKMRMLCVKTTTRIPIFLNVSFAIKIWKFISCEIQTYQQGLCTPNIIHSTKLTILHTAEKIR